MRGYGAGCEELVDQGLGAVPSGAGDVSGGRSVGERVGIVAQEIAEVECVGDWFGDGDGSGGCVLKTLDLKKGVCLGEWG